MKYKKKKNCNYPTSKIFYCWGYAQNKDRGLTDEQIEKGICKHGDVCEFYVKRSAKRKSKISQKGGKT